MNEASIGVSAASPTELPRAVHRWLTATLPDDEVPTDSQRALQVACFWRDTLLDVQQADPGVAMVAREAELPAPMVTWVNGQAVVHAPANTKVFDLKQGRSDELRLALEDRAVVTSGDLSFACRYVRPATVVSSEAVDSNDLRFYKYLAFAVLGFHALVAAMVVTPIDGYGPGDSLFGPPGRLAKLLITPPKPVVTKPITGLEAAARAPKEEGKIGRVDATKKEAAPSKPGDKRETDRKQVKAALASLFGDDGAKGELFKEGGLNGAILNGIGGLKAGGDLGDARGVGGMGARGNGPGGGGDKLHLGGVGAMGGGGSCTVNCAIGLLGRSHSEVTVSSPPHIVGGLDKETILKVVRRHQSEIKFCYESELANHPKLGGKITLAWTIDPSGAVSVADVAESGLDNANVEACVLRRVRTWKFPEPVGGGVVAVTFPWIFKTAGDDAE